MKKLRVDLFAGCGGVSEGFRMAFGSPPDVAVNHCHHAIQMHAVNHPETHHEEASAWEIRPKNACAGRVDILWRAKTARKKPRQRQRKPAAEVNIPPGRGVGDVPQATRQKWKPGFPTN